MENGDIPDANIQAIVSTYSDYPARNGRLSGTQLWSVPGSVSNPWIQADIGYQTYVSGVVTQGDGGHYSPDWVTTLKVSLPLRLTLTMMRSLSQMTTVKPR